MIAFFRAAKVLNFTYFNRILISLLLLKSLSLISICPK
jgi:hypothetical protein